MRIVICYLRNNCVNSGCIIRRRGRLHFNVPIPYLVFPQLFPGLLGIRILLILVLRTLHDNTRKGVSRRLPHYWSGEGTQFPYTQIYHFVYAVIPPSGSVNVAELYHQNCLVQSATVLAMAEHYAP